MLKKLLAESDVICDGPIHLPANRAFPSRTVSDHPAIPRQLSHSEQPSAQDRRISMRYGANRRDKPRFVFPAI